MPPILPPSADIAAVLDTCAQKEDQAYAGAFRKRDAEAPGVGWAGLSEVFGYLFRSRSGDAPFAPMAVIGDKRSAVPDDLSDPQLDALALTLRDVDDPEYRARVGDVLWLRRRDPEAARIAVEGYLASGTRLEDPTHWVASMERYERGARIARQLGAREPLLQRILDHIEARVLHYDGKDPLYFSLRAMQLLEGYADNLPPERFAAVAAIAGRIASSARQAGNYDRARSYFEIQAKLLSRAKDAKGAEAARVTRAECFAEEADSREKGGSALAARFFWEDALQAFRERPALRARVAEIQQRLTDAGTATLAELKSHSIEIDLSREAEAARSALTGRSREDAFFGFALLIGFLSPSELRAEVEESIREHPLQASIDAQMFDASGRKVGTRPSALTTDPAQLEASIAGFMEEHARMHRGPRVHGYVAPAMHQLLSEHELDERAVDHLIGDSQLISPGRKPLFVAGIVAGLRWDFSTALHLLIPQVEHGLRKLLRQQGITPHNVDANGIEEVWSYERILSHPAIHAILGEALTFELRSLLVERLGPNLRHGIAHGMLSHAALNSDVALYLWWVLLALISRPTSQCDEYVKRKRDARGRQA